jgi:hypothetical protein
MKGASRRRVKKGTQKKAPPAEKIFSGKLDLDIFKMSRSVLYIQECISGAENGHHYYHVAVNRKNKVILLPT